jgi:hypothetical protein
VRPREKELFNRVTELLEREMVDDQSQFAVHLIMCRNNLAREKDPC